MDALELDELLLQNRPIPFAQPWLWLGPEYYNADYDERPWSCDFRWYCYHQGVEDLATMPAHRFECFWKLYIAAWNSDREYRDYQVRKHNKMPFGM